MTVTSEDISLGVCDIIFNGLDLGSTKGGVEVSVKTANHTVKCDQFGETPVKDIILGTEVTIKVPMLETNMKKLLAVMPQGHAVTASGGSDVVGVEIRSGVNIDLLALSGLLKLHPTGVDPAVKKDDFTAFKAAPVPNFAFKYESNNERVFEVTFNCYPDVSHNYRIAAFGDAGL